MRQSVSPTSRGLLVLYEYPLWVLSPEMFGGYTRKYNLDDLTEDMQIWLKDVWNHPSIVYFNATEESKAPWMAERVLPKVRSLDLSNRAWGNSYNSPMYPNDPVEDHPYEFQMNGIPGIPMKFDMFQLEGKEKLCGDSAKEGVLVLTLEKGDEVYELGRKPLYLAPLGQQTHKFEAVMPDVTGDYTLVAAAKAADGETTLSRRWVHLQAERMLTDAELFAQSQAEVKQVWTDTVPDQEV